MEGPRTVAVVLAEIGELLQAGRIRPVIDKVFPFDQAKEALAYLENGRAKGKVVVRMAASMGKGKGG